MSKCNKRGKCYLGEDAGSQACWTARRERVGARKEVSKGRTQEDEGVSLGNGRNGKPDISRDGKRPALARHLKPCVARVEEVLGGGGGSEGTRQQWEGEEQGVGTARKKPHRTFWAMMRILDVF